MPNFGRSTDKTDMSKAKAVNKSGRGEYIELFKSLILFLAIALCLRASVVEAFKIPSSSMVPTLEIGDHILVSKLSYGLRLPLKTDTLFNYSLPDRGDVVVFTKPDDPLTPEEDESDKNIVKRVVGLPGDLVEVRGTKVYINDKEYKGDSQYAVWSSGGVRDFPPTYVPENKVFLLGDNRDHSKDSRYWPDPFLSVSRIKGRAFIIYWNTSMLQRMFSIIH